jgi:WD40 repeat protein
MTCIVGVPVQIDALSSITFQNGIPLLYFLLIGGTDSGQILIRDIRDGGIQTFVSQAHGAAVTAVQMDTSGKKFITGSVMGNIKVWGVVYSPSALADPFLKNTLSIDGKNVYIRLVPIFEVSTQGSPEKIAGLNDFTSIAFAQKDRKVCSIKQKGDEYGILS